MENRDDLNSADAASTSTYTEFMEKTLQRGNSTARTAPIQENNTTNTMQSPDNFRFISSAISIQDLRHIIRALKAPASPLPKFSGLSHEDLEVFIQECESYFEQSGTEPPQWIRTAGSSLLDEAARWRSPFKSFNLPWDKFKALFRNKYASQSVENGLRVILYLCRQGEKEPSAIFLQKKYLQIGRAHV